MTETATNESVEYVSTDAAVEALAAELEKAGRIAVDTEADSLHHYFEKVCLIQIAAADSVYLVDPLTGANLKPLLEVLSRRPLLLHGADYDLRMLFRDFGFRASEVFDTMIASKLLGYERINLAGLVEKHFEVVLPKHGQRADWSRRPLPPALIGYAANDTRYLERLAQALEKELDAAGRLNWHREICRKLLDQAAAPLTDSDPEKVWRVKGWKTLESPRAQAVLRSLWHWRDTEAQRVNLPPFRVLSNEALVALAAWGEKNDDYATVPKLPRNCTGRRLHALKKAVTQARRLPDSQLPKPIVSARPPRIPNFDELNSKLKQIRDAKAVEIGLEPSLLAPAATLIAVAKARPATLEALKEAGELHDWQVALLGEDFLKIIVGIKTRTQQSHAGGTPE
ncbi:MAG: HRDC domain-containing protein [Candidatus Sumerlaeaceae bacterium]|nr:HRDC domain-containing protein [Candidatus Sumerlaeaceae bacterium]